MVVTTKSVVDQMLRRGREKEAIEQYGGWKNPIIHNSICGDGKRKIQICDRITGKILFEKKED